MLVADLQSVLERLAPFALAEAGDNSGLLVGDPKAPVCRVLAALELTGPVLDEALAGGFDTVLTHHPLLFSPVRSLVESNEREKLLRRLVAGRMTLIACHTNLDSAVGGLADIAGEALGLQDMESLRSAPAGRRKLVGFVPVEAVERVAAAVFAVGAGHIGLYRKCAFAAQGTGWFTGDAGSRPAVGQAGRHERVREVRWETVVPGGLVGEAIRAFVAAHPYEEPAFDVYPVEDVVVGAGLGRVGRLPRAAAVRELAERAVATFGLSGALLSGDGERSVSRVGVIPGGGRSLLDEAAGRCEVLLTGDVGYHAADQAAEKGLSLIDLPHGEFEWWAFRRWTEHLMEQLSASGVTVAASESWRSPWERVDAARTDGRPAASRKAAGVPTSVPADSDPAGGYLRLWIDGGSRGNPGPSAVGVVIENADGAVVEAIGRVIGVATNNVAEYRALLTGLENAARRGAAVVEVASDSELLVKQMRGQYKVKNEGLQPLFAEARDRAAGFCSFTIRHIPREENARADALVNKALDEHEKAGL